MEITIRYHPDSETTQEMFTFQVNGRDVYCEDFQLWYLLGKLSAIKYPDVSISWKLVYSVQTDEFGAIEMSHLTKTQQWLYSIAAILISKFFRPMAVPPRIKEKI